MLDFMESDQEKTWKGQDRLNIYEKLLEIQKEVKNFEKKEVNQTDRYKYVGSEIVVTTIREKMNELGLLLIPEITNAAVLEGTTKSGTTRFFSGISMTMTWVNVDKLDEKVICKWYAQGVDLAGEKGVGKALTYAEKYFMLKFFHIPTSKDDPDGGGKGDNEDKGKKPQTQAGKETALDCRNWSNAMLKEICGGDAEKTKTAIKIYTKLKAPNGDIIEGKEDLKDVSDAAMPIVYASIKAEYKKRFGKEYDKSSYKGDGENAD